MKKITSNDTIQCLTHFYPSTAQRITGEINLNLLYPLSTVYGFNLGETNLIYDGRSYALVANSFFSLPITPNSPVVSLKCFHTTSLFVRHGYLGQTILCGIAEEQGRLTYINGCSDSLLIYPPRLSDPSLNLLYFPKNTSQSHHTHPTIRLGVIASGEGMAHGLATEMHLATGDVFIIEPNESHRFSTSDLSMRIITYHPDGDFGPTDKNHTMINRTYLNKS